jgi:hypothetical protein
MPGQLPPEPAQGAPAPQAAQAAPQGGANPVQEAAQSAFRGLSMLAKIAGRQNAPEAEQFQALLSQFQSLIESMMGGGAPQQPGGAPQPVQGASPEAGAARVRPVQ